MERLLKINNAPPPHACYADVLKQIRWVDVSDMGGLGVTTGMKKVMALASKARGSSNSNNNGNAGSPPAKKNTKRKTGRDTKKRTEGVGKKDTTWDKAKHSTYSLPPGSVQTTEADGKAIDGRKRHSDDCDGSGKDMISNARSRSKRTKGGGGKVGR